MIETCDQCNGAGGDNNTFCCGKCNGSGGIVTIRLGIPDARKVIDALHSKEDEWYRKTLTPSCSDGRRVYCEIEQSAIARIRNQIERAMP